MRDRGAGLRQEIEILPRRPMQPGVMVEKDAVANDGMATKRADIMQPADRRLAVAAEHLVEFGDVLRSVNLER